MRMTAETSKHVGVMWFNTVHLVGTVIDGKLIVAFPWQQWLRERATMLWYTYIVYLV
jgi:hypothetical protein